MKVSMQEARNCTDDGVVRRGHGATADEGAPTTHSEYIIDDVEIGEEQTIFQELHLRQRSFASRAAPCASVAHQPYRGDLADLRQGFLGLRFRA